MEARLGAAALVASVREHSLSAPAVSCERNTPHATPSDLGAEMHATRRDWIVSRGFDLAWFVNAWWVLAWLPDVLWSGATPRLEFWQVYFLTTPHRWLTLLLVATDRDRRAGRRDRTFVLLALGLGLLVLAVQGLTGAFTCLLLVDYTWNAWHFASQHTGILRMYARLSPLVAANDRRRSVENICLRGLVLYTFVRLAGWSTGWLEGSATAMNWLTVCDVLFVVLGITFAVASFLPSPVAAEGSGVRGRATPVIHQPFGKRLYALSVCGIYASLLVALLANQKLLIASLATAVAAFHAIEYLAVVSHYARRRTTVGSGGLFRGIARHWSAALVLLLLGFGFIATLAEPRYATWWLGLNVWAALVHYAFDGMIWKLRRADTSQALGLTAGAP